MTKWLLLHRVEMTSNFPGPSKATTTPPLLIQLQLVVAKEEVGGVVVRVEGSGKINDRGAVEVVR